MVESLNGYLCRRTIESTMPPLYHLSTIRRFHNSPIRLFYDTDNHSTIRPFHYCTNKFTMQRIDYLTIRRFHQSTNYSSSTIRRRRLDDSTFQRCDYSTTMIQPFYDSPIPRIVPLYHSTIRQFDDDNSRIPSFDDSNILPLYH